MENISIFNDFSKKRKSGVAEHYQVIVTDESIYLVNSSNNYTAFVEYIFAGVGLLTELVGGIAGIGAGVATDFTGNKLTKALKKMSNDRSDKRLKKVLSNLDRYSKEKHGVFKIDFHNLKQITIKNGYIINGKTYVEFVTEKDSHKLFSKKRIQTDLFKNTLKKHNNAIQVNTKFL